LWYCLSYQLAIDHEDQALEFHHIATAGIRASRIVNDTSAITLRRLLKKLQLLVMVSVRKGELTHDCFVLALLSSAEEGQVSVKLADGALMER
jgi:hypothetical protein